MCSVFSSSWGKHTHTQAFKLQSSAEMNQSRTDVVVVVLVVILVVVVFVVICRNESVTN